MASRLRTQPAWNTCSHVGAAWWPLTAAVAVVATMAAAGHGRGAPCDRACYRCAAGLRLGSRARSASSTPAALPNIPVKTHWVTRTAAAAAADGGGGGGGGGGEAVVLVKEGIRVEASLRCEDGTMALPLLTLLPPLLPPLLLRAVVFPGAFETVVAGGRPVGAQRSVRPRAAAQPCVVAGAGVAAGRQSLLGRSRTSGKGISAWIFSSC